MLKIKNWLITGDTHGHTSERLSHIPSIYKPEETALIILGDAGINFYLNKTDLKNKKLIQNTGITVYCVRGNHEERPENIPSMIDEYDNEVDGFVYLEPQFPNIRYFKDGGTYYINNHKVLVIGGAYSVDKWYRLSHFSQGTEWTGWFKDEQLTTIEMNKIEEVYMNNHFDFVLTHTCPYSWQPIDLFLNSIDQSSVDNTMEHWLETFKDEIVWSIWLFGHFHDDRLVRPSVEMFFQDIDNLEAIYDRWINQNDTELETMNKDPRYEEGV